MKNQKLIIITDCDSLGDVDRNAENFANFEKLESKAFLKFENNGLVEVDELDDAEIVFVWDRFEKVETEDIQDWWNTFLEKRKNGEKWYVIHHSKGIQPAPSDSDSVIYKSGTHAESNPVYGKVVAILLDNEDNKKDRIIKEVFTPKLEYILAFLHSCLEDAPNGEKCREYKEKIEIEYDLNLEGDFLSDKYLQSLNALRDKLLKEAIEK